MLLVVMSFCFGSSINPWLENLPVVAPCDQRSCLDQRKDVMVNFFRPGGATRC
jgi:hypothetical protein